MSATATMSVMPWYHKLAFLAAEHQHWYRSRKSWSASHVALHSHHVLDRRSLQQYSWIFATVARSYSPVSVCLFILSVGVTLEAASGGETGLLQCWNTNDVPAGSRDDMRNVFDRHYLLCLAMFKTFPTTKTLCKHAFGCRTFPGRQGEVHFYMTVYLLTKHTRRKRNQSAYNHQCSQQPHTRGHTLENFNKLSYLSPPSRI